MPELLSVGYAIVQPALKPVKKQAKGRADPQLAKTNVCVLLHC